MGFHKPLERPAISRGGNVAPGGGRLTRILGSSKIAMTVNTKKRQLGQLHSRPC